MRAATRRVGTASLTLVGLGAMALGLASSASAVIPQGITGEIVPGCYAADSTTTITQAVVNVTNTTDQVIKVDVTERGGDGTDHDAGDFYVGPGKTQGYFLGANGTYKAQIGNDVLVDYTTITTGCTSATDEDPAPTPSPSASTPAPTPSTSAPAPTQTAQPVPTPSETARATSSSCFADSFSVSNGKFLDYNSITYDNGDFAQASLYDTNKDGYGDYALASVESADSSVIGTVDFADTNYDGTFDKVFVDVNGVDPVCSDVSLQIYKDGSKPGDGKVVTTASKKNVLPVAKTGWDQMMPVAYTYSQNASDEASNWWLVGAAGALVVAGAGARALSVTRRRR